MKKKYWYILIISFIISFFVDKPVLNFFINNRIEFLNNFIVWFTNPYTLLFIVFIITSLFLYNEHKKKYIIPLWLSGFIGFIAASFLKFILLRARPDVISLVPINTNSFPSAHATVIFAVIPLLDKEFKKLKSFWIFFGILIVLSRLYVGAHYPSDLLGGIILGLFIGTLVLKKLNLTKS